jgi:nucleotide-binding universal stress UspA family protein
VNIVRVLLWVIEGTWAGCVDAAAPALPADAEVTILHVAQSDVPEIAEGARAGLLGRSRPRREPGARMATVSQEAADDLLAKAAERLGRPAETLSKRGPKVARVILETAAEGGYDLLVAARDGDRDHVGPGSLGYITRFVVDHAPCTVLLVWPDGSPGLGSMPAPPPPGKVPPPPPPPPEHPW